MLEVSKGEVFLGSWLLPSGMEHFPMEESRHLITTALRFRVLIVPLFIGVFSLIDKCTCSIYHFCRLSVEHYIRVVRRAQRVYGITFSFVEVNV